jgi:3-methyladenine DNA glycosylase AlkD
MTAVEIEARLLQGADAEFGAGQRRFFQQEVATYGVRADYVRAVARQVFAEIKRWPAAQRNRLMNDLWKLGKLEAGGLVCHVYRRFGRQCGAGEFKLFESWIDRYVNSWATGDGVASWLLAAAIANAPELRFRLEAWTAAPKRWKRRAAAVALLQEARHWRQTEWIFAIADRLLDDRDDMVDFTTLDRWWRNARDSIIGARALNGLLDPKGCNPGRREGGKVRAARTTKPESHPGGLIVLIGL